MLKGKSKIQLFNAKTGKLEHQQENTNIVTNAVQDIINDNDPLGVGKVVMTNSGDNLSKALLRREHLTPLAAKAFGGVLLWDNTISEDPTITMPPDGVNEVGHAGNTYAGANAFRGSYNTNESGSLENGYRHVWDFGTDKANGTIKCLSLTSQYGGMCGYCNDENGNDETYGPYSYHYFSADEEYKAFNTDLNFASFDADGSHGTFLYFAQNSNGGFYGIKRPLADFTKILHITFAKPGVLSLNGMSGIIEEKELITGINQYALTHVHEDKIHEVYLQNSTTLVHKTYSLDGAALNTVTVDLPTAVYNYSSGRTAYAFYYNGAYYYRSNDISGNVTYKRCSATGENLGEAFTIPPHSGTTAYRPLGFLVDNNGAGLLILGTTSSNSYHSARTLFIYPNGKTCLTNIENNGWGTTPTANSPYALTLPTATPFKSPFVYVSVGSSHARIILGVDCRYLATINNLSTPVTKTSAQVMKVTYEITEG